MPGSRAVSKMQNGISLFIFMLLLVFLILCPVGLHHKTLGLSIGTCADGFAWFALVTAKPCVVRSPVYLEGRFWQSPGSDPLAND
jgi:hypothetical protein